MHGRADRGGHVLVDGRRRSGAGRASAPALPGAVCRLQALAGNRATGLLLQRAVPGPGAGGRTTVQRQPTIDLANLYAGKGDPTVVADFVRLQELLSDRARALPHLQALNDALAAKLERAPMPNGSPAARGEAANAVLDEVLSSFESRCGFSAEPILVEFASVQDFTEFADAGQQFHDVGAGPVHGEFTHRIQWFIAMHAITGGTFGPPVPPFTHTPKELFKASMDQAYAIPATSGVAYMWDWVFDRIAGLRPAGSPPSSDYNPAKDAWTHPGESGQKGALSNDIVDNPDHLPGIDTLSEVRAAQIAGHADHKAAMKLWFGAAAELNLADGHAVTGGPSYFRRSLLPGPDAIRELRMAKGLAEGLIDRAGTWAGLAPISLNSSTTRADLPALVRLKGDVAKVWVARRESVAAARGTTTLATGLVDAWYRRISNALAAAVWAVDGATTGADTAKAALAGILVTLDQELTALQQTAGWRVVT